MTAHEIFSRLSPEESHEIFESLHEENKAAYKGAMQVTASRRKLRSVFLERKTRPDRHRWMQNVLASKVNEDLSLELLQNWLLAQHRSMICSFLDACSITHSEGLLDDIPPQPPTATLKAAVDALFANHPPVAAKVYLHVFQPTEDETWPDLDELLATDPRLILPSTR